MKKTLGIPKPKKVSKKYLRKKADTAMSKYIRTFIGICQIAGLDTVHCSTVLQDMHIVTRGNYTLRYDPKNHLCGCSGHHVYYTNNPKKWQALMEKHFSSRWSYIQKHENDKTTKTEASYREIEALYTQKLKDLSDPTYQAFIDDQIITEV